MLEFRLKWQSNQAPKFLTGSVLEEMMDSPIVRVALLVFCSCAFVPMSINSVLESSSYGCRRGTLPLLQWRRLDRVIVWIECQTDTGIIGVTVRCWQVLANDIKKLISVKGEQHWAETGALRHNKLQIKTV